MQNGRNAVVEPSEGLFFPSGGQKIFPAVVKNLRKASFFLRKPSFPHRKAKKSFRRGSRVVGRAIETFGRCLRFVWRPKISSETGGDPAKFDD